MFFEPGSEKSVLLGSSEYAYASRRGPFHRGHYRRVPSSGRLRELGYRLSGNRLNLANEETVVRFMLEGQYECPQRVVCFNTAEGRARDVSGDIAKAVANAVSYESDLPEGTREFVERQLGERWNSRTYEFTKRSVAATWSVLVAYDFNSGLYPATRRFFTFGIESRFGDRRFLFDHSHTAMPGKGCLSKIEQFRK